MNGHEHHVIPDVAINIPLIDFGAVQSEILLAFVAMALLMVEVFVPAIRKTRVAAYMALAGIVVSAGITISLWGGESFSSFSGLYQIDRFSQFAKLLFLLTAGLTVLLSMDYAEQEDINHGEYYALILFAVIGMMVMASGNDLITIFLGIETMSISVYALSGYTRKRLESSEAALKYFLLGGFATGFLLYGMALIYGATGHTQLERIAEIVGSMSNPRSSAILIAGMILLTVGFGFKIAAAPFHAWTPDVYQGAPATITGFMSAGVKAAGFAVFLRVFYTALAALQVDWATLLAALAVITMTVGNLAALRQENIKRMLAYSSIAHAGYIMLGFIAASETGIAAIMFYLLAYTFMNLGAFAIVILVGRKGEKRVNIEDYTGLGYNYPVLALAMAIFLFSLVGIPPTAGFMGKFYIFTAALQAGYVKLAVIAVLNSVVSAYYYLRVLVVMYMRGEEDPEVSPIRLQPAMILALVVTVYGVLRMGVFPADYITFAQNSLFPF